MADRRQQNAGAAQGQIRPRIFVVDAARTVALMGMVVYHFIYDLAYFRLVPAAVILDGVMPVFARLVAGSFIFLAGVSLFLAHRHAIRWRAFGRRLLVLSAAAAAISVATYLAMPDQYIFFGILHSIAFSSVIGLAFLRLPWGVSLMAAVVALVLPVWMRAQGLSLEAPVWLGLSRHTPATMDFEPVFPWIAPFLAGLAIARLLEGQDLWRRLSGWPGRGQGWHRALAGPGRHSLVIYLLHQPVLFGLIYSGIWLAR